MGGGGQKVVQWIAGWSNRYCTGRVALDYGEMRCPSNTASVHRVTGRSLLIVYVKRLLVAGTRGSFVAAPRVGCAIEDLQLKCN
ncbi:MAG: hypothetical protein QF541_06680 [Lentisphaeria bacterium]|nr:hypothetical protein [Lentisphaeria bacterium]